MSRFTLTPLLLLLATACVESYRGPPDAGSPDGGTQTSTVPPTSLDGRIECNPVQNVGCDGTRGESCVYDPATDNALCRRLTLRLPHEEPCSPLENVCDRNLACTALPQDYETTCYRVCEPESGAGCENLPGSSPNYICQPLEGRTYGVCVGTGVRCDPNEDPCAESEVCSMRSGEAVCLPAGAAERGASCAQEQCKKGFLCMKLADQEGPKCYLPCSVEEGICPNPDEVCTGVDGQRFGLCQRTTAACSPLAAAESPCPSGQVCGLDRTDLSCMSPGPSTVGEVCDVRQGCQEAAPGQNGAVCARLLGEDAPRCYEACDLSFPACSNPGTGCSDIGLEFGLCI